jgi:hypothetical protein
VLDIGHAVIIGCDVAELAVGYEFLERIALVAEALGQCSEFKHHVPRCWGRHRGRA